MSYEMFNKAIEAAAINAEREKRLILGAHCNRDYEGEIKKAGESVTIHVVGGTKIYVLEKDGTYTANGTDYLGQTMSGNIAGSGKDIVQAGIPDPDADDVTDITINVKKIAIFNKLVGDYDQYLSHEKNLLGKIRTRIGSKIAETEDLEIAKTIIGFQQAKFDNTVFNPSSDKLVYTDSDSANHKVNVLDFIDSGVQYFAEKEMWDDTIYVEGSPKFGRYVRRCLGREDTDNSAILKGRKVPVYNNCGVFQTNAVTKVSAGHEYVIFRTEDAVVFADPFTEVEPYRSSKGFADCLRGFQLFDCGIAFPQEVRWAEVKY